MDNVNITINGQVVSVPKDYTVLEAAEKLGINVPRLCFLKDINETSACRLCVVDVKGMRGLKNSCTLAIYDGMEIETDTEDTHNSVVENLKLLASNHVFECWACDREHNCELLDLMRRYNVENIYGESLSYAKKVRRINDTSSTIVLDSGKCVLCGRCVSACEVHTGLGILQFNERGNGTFVGPANFHPMDDSGCISCGKCVQACPTAAIKEKSHTDGVLDALRNPNKTVIVTTHPSVAVTLGEDFGTDIGANVEGMLFASLKQLGIDDIFDYNFADQFRTMNEAEELINRVKQGKDLPLFTSCAPGWLPYLEQYEPTYLPQVTKTKSTQQIAGALVKHHYSHSLGLQKENVVFISITPMIDKKDEAERDTNQYGGIADVDYVLTTKEYARLLKRKGIDFLRLQGSAPFGELAELTSVQKTYYPVSGRLAPTLDAVSMLLNEQPQNLKFKSARGQKDIKEATFKIAGKDINVAVVQGGMTIQEFFTYIKKTKKSYHFVEYQEQPGGCLEGGGEPIHSAYDEDYLPIHQIRSDALVALVDGRKEQYDSFKETVQSLYNKVKDDSEVSIQTNMFHAEYEAQLFYK